MSFKLADSDPLCLYELLRTQADQTPDSVAIAAPGRSALTYGALIDRINELIAQRIANISTVLIKMQANQWLNASEEQMVKADTSLAGEMNALADKLNKS